MVVRYIDTQIQNPQINQNSKPSALTQTFFNNPTSNLQQLDRNLLAIDSPCSQTQNIANFILS